MINARAEGEGEGLETYEVIKYWWRVKVVMQSLRKCVSTEQSRSLHKLAQIAAHALERRCPSDL